MSHAFLVEALRTPLTQADGPWSLLPPEHLAAVALRGVLSRSGLRADQLDGLFVGLACGVDPLEVAATVGVPLRVPTLGLDLGDCSGLAALDAATAAMNAGRNDLVAVVAVGSLPALHPETRSLAWRAALPSRAEAARLGALQAGVGSGRDPWPETGRVRAAQARSEGRFLCEVVDLAGDFADATPVAAVGAADGAAPVLCAAAVLLASDDACGRLRLQPRARVVSSALGATEPALCWSAQVAAARLAVSRSGLDLADLHLAELDDAWPDVMPACLAQLGLDLSRTCIQGGGLALGRPAGAVGLRQLCTLVHSLDADHRRLGLCAAADGRGRGAAVIVDAAMYR